MTISIVITNINVYHKTFKLTITRKVKEAVSILDIKYVTK